MRSPFWGMIATLVGVSLPFVILWRRHVALKATRRWTTRTATSHEMAQLRWRGRLSIWLFLLFWIAALGLIVATTLAGASATIQRLVILMVCTMAGAGIAFHLSIRCPVCNFRLGYQCALGIPPTCERCGTTFRR